jgi:ribosomal protein S18 acetylase RimI-like enzyme
MQEAPSFHLRIYVDCRQLPKEAEELFAAQLSETRQPLPESRCDRDQWRSFYVCALVSTDHVLGGACFDVGPKNFGPLAQELVAIVEHVLVRPEYRRQGIGSSVMEATIEAAREAGCQCMRCNVRWDDPAEIALFKSCGFALVDINGEGEGGSYLAAKPLRGYSCNA